MHQLSDGANLAQEQLLGAFVARQIGSEDLEGDGATHGAVPGLVDATHAAPAKLVEDDITVEMKTAGPADEETFRLEFRQPTLLDQQAGQRLAAFVLRG